MHFQKRPYLKVLLSPEHHEVLHHLLAQIVIDAVDLFLSEEGGEVSGQLFRALKVVSKWLLYDHPVPSSTMHTHREENEKISSKNSTGFNLGFHFLHSFTPTSEFLLFNKHSFT